MWSGDKMHTNHIKQKIGYLNNNRLRVVTFEK